MTIKDFNLLNIDVYDGEKLGYSGECSEAPDELKQKRIVIDRIDGKKLIIHLETEADIEAKQKEQNAINTEQEDQQ